MTLYEFVNLVVKMRSAQKDFFINHSQQALTRAKQLEKRVDAAALELVNAQPQQGGLFSRDMGTNHEAESKIQ